MATKLLLIEDVEDLGRSGDVVTVRNGFWRNFLQPRGLAVMANKNSLRKQETLKEARLQQAVLDKKDAEELAKKLESIALTTEVKVDHEGNMYGSVSHQDIASLLHEQHGIEIEKRYFQLKHPIKETGAHRIDFKLKEGVPASLSLKIVAEGVDIEAAIQAAKSEEIAVVEEITEEAEGS